MKQFETGFHHHPSEKSIDKSGINIIIGLVVYIANGNRKKINNKGWFEITGVDILLQKRSENMF